MFNPAAVARRFEISAIPGITKLLRDMFKDEQVRADHPEQAKRYGDNVLKTAYNIARLSRVPNFGAYVLADYRETPTFAYGMASIIGNITVELASGQKFHGTNIDYWLTPDRDDVPEIHTAVAERLLIEARGAKDFYFYPNVIAFVQGPYGEPQGPNRGLAQVLPDIYEPGEVAVSGLHSAFLQDDTLLRSILYVDGDPITT